MPGTWWSRCASAAAWAPPGCWKSPEPRVALSSTQRNRRIVLASRPQGRPVAENFRLEEVDLPPLADGQVLVAIEYLSLDPYMRGRMDDAKSYAKPQPLDETMQGGTVGYVVESRDPSLKPGDAVLGMLGWQTHAIVSAKELTKVAPGLPLSVWVGPAGMPGVTAWHGVNKILEPQPGQTLCVDAASGAVGSVVGQLAKAAGARVVGIAGGPDKCRLVVDEYGFDACIDHRDPAFVERLAAATPDGVDRVFENVGGPILDALLDRMNAFGRIAICGLISGYHGEEIPMRRVRSILVNKLLIQGFIVSDHPAEWPIAIKELAGRIAAGTLKYRETIAVGLESAPEAFFNMLKGGNVGKQLVRVGSGRS